MHCAFRSFVVVSDFGFFFYLDCFLIQCTNFIFTACDLLTCPGLCSIYKIGTPIGDIELFSGTDEAVSVYQSILLRNFFHALPNFYYILKLREEVTYFE